MSTSSEILALIDRLPPDQLAQSLSSGTLHQRISGLTLTEIRDLAVELLRLRQELEGREGFEAAARVDLVRDRVMDEHTGRSSSN